MNEESLVRSGAEFVEIIDDFLKKKEISRRQFCSLIDIPNSTIASWKSKNVMPSVELVAKVAQFMKVSLDWLVYKEPVIPVEDIKTLRLDKDTYHNILTPEKTIHINQSPTTIPRDIK